MVRSWRETIPALQNELVFEIKSSDIFQSSPSAIIWELQQLARLISHDRNPCQTRRCGQH